MAQINFKPGPLRWTRLDLEAAQRFANPTTEQEPVTMEDLEVIRLMNPDQHRLKSHPCDWPEWAKRDAEILANYRARCAAAHSAP